MFAVNGTRGHDVTVVVCYLRMSVLRRDRFGGVTWLPSMAKSLVSTNVSMTSFF